MKPFDSLRVVDLSHVWAGPAATRVLSDLGADVIKIERPTRPDQVRIAYVAGNDTTGDFWNRAPYFTVRNAGKRGLALNLGTEDGMAILHRLLETADVLVESFTPRVMENFGLSFDKIHERYPKLIMMSLCGYGQTGPRRNDPAFGMGMEPASGVATVSGYEGEGPLKSGNTWTDPFAGFHGLGALLAALYHRQKTGRGQHIDVAMQEGLIQLLGAYFEDYWMNGRMHQGHGNRRPGQVRGIYPCEGDDAWVAISIRNDAEWERFCRATGNETWLQDQRFATMADRIAHHDDLDGLIAAWTRGRTKFEAMDLLQRSGVPAGAVQNAREIVANEHLTARHFWDALPIKDFGTLPIQRYFPVRVDGHGIGARAGAPALGQHTDEVLKEVLGYDDQKLAELRAKGVIEGEPQNWISPEARAALIQPIAIFKQTGAILGVDEQFREHVQATVDAARSAPD
jgi:crotonobetainyl-CoA:carnitine CoA-transferase CaiB-like acyl-CoA transferase